MSEDAAVAIDGNWLCNASSFALRVDEEGTRRSNTMANGIFLSCQTNQSGEHASYRNGSEDVCISAVVWCLYEPMKYALHDEGVVSLRRR